jgi:hypothetical protein
MPYVRRDVMSRIESVHRTSAAGAVEYLDASDAELRRFLREEFGPADAAEGRPDLLPVLGEVLGLFLTKGLVKVEELSHEAQAICGRLLETPDDKGASRFSASGFVEIIDDSAFGGLPDSR